MKSLIFSLLILSSPAFADVVLDEIKVNLDDVSKKVEQAKKQISDLEDNDVKLKKNIGQLEIALDKKLNEQKQGKENFNDYAQKLAATGSARKEFDRSLLKDKQELELVLRDIQMVEQKLVRLKASRKALEESIEISEDNLGQMNDRSGSWQKNRDHIQGELNALDKDITDLEKQKEAQEKTRTENQQALNKWKQTLATQETTFQKLDTRYRQAVKEAEKKAKNR